MVSGRLSIRWGRILRLTGFILAILAVLLVALVMLWARAYAYNFAHNPCTGPLQGLDDEGYPSEEISIQSPKGYTLHGWLSHGSRHPEIAVIALPGASGNGYFALPDARILADAGYSTLVMEHRSCANPPQLHSGGYYESFDLEAAVDALKARPDIEHVGVLGFSTGGSASLLAASRDANIEATVAIGGFDSLENDLYDPDQGHNFVDLSIRWFTGYFLQSELGVPLSEISPLAHIGRISPRPLLLIYGDVGEEASGRALYAAAGEPKELWIVPGAQHGAESTVQPDEYRRRVLAFFSRAFKLDDQP